MIIGALLKVLVKALAGVRERKCRLFTALICVYQNRCFSHASFPPEERPEKNIFSSFERKKKKMVKKK